MSTEFEGREKQTLKETEERKEKIYMTFKVNPLLHR